MDTYVKSCGMDNATKHTVTQNRNNYCLVFSIFLIMLKFNDKYYCYLSYTTCNDSLKWFEDDDHNEPDKIIIIATSLYSWPPLTYCVVEISSRVNIIITLKQIMQWGI